MLSKKDHREFLKELGLTDQEIDSAPNGLTYKDERPDLTEKMIEKARSNQKPDSPAP
ncbi:MAG TPA: hypothetical protein VIG74_04545 [Alphaproteobacteria bacterium]|jgi:hypothetical protein